MEKIVIETNLKTVPESCAKCKFKQKIELDTVVCTANTTWTELTKTYVKEKNNWCYIKPKSCPLCIYEIIE